MSNSTCLLFTQSYPYGDSEVFLETEINFLAIYFSNVVIFPLNTGNGKMRKVPSNVTIEYLFKSDMNCRINFTDLFLLTKVLVFEIIHQPIKMLSQLRSNFSYLKQECKKAKIFGDFLKRSNLGSNCFFYSYWFDTWSLILSLVKKSHKEYGFQFYSRAHGFDLFEDQTKFGYHPFKNFMLRNVNSVYSVSKVGQSHLQNKYKKYKHKIRHSYLGSKSNRYHYVSEGTDFVIASCANIRAIKRLELIPDILNELPSTFKAKWVLIGDGEMLSEIKSKTKLLGSNIECVFMGNLESYQVHEFYAKNKVDLFISVSRSEGIPFTMMEAISYGIPLLSTDVGGCSEICNEQTGVLINKEFDIKEVAKEILLFSSSPMNTIEFRNGVRKFWEQNFNAEENYSKFYSEISKN